MSTFAGGLARAACGFLAVTLFAAAPPDFSERLRKAIQIPVPMINVGLTNLSATIDGLPPLDPPADWEAELRRLQGLADQSPDNAQLHRQVGIVLSRLGRTAAANEAFARELRLLRADLSAHPEDPLAMARLGYALGVDQRQEAESLLRRAVASGSDRWECHLRYASFLSFPLMISSSTNTPTESALAAPLQCFDRAVTLAGRQSALPAVMRAIFCGFRAQLWSRVLNDPALVEKRIQEDLRVMVENLQHAEGLETEDYRIVAVRLFVEVNLNRLSRPQSEEPLPESARRALEEGLQRLTALATRSPNPRRTAEIWTAVGLLEFLRNGSAAAREAAERALQLDPLNPQAWELLLAVCVGKGGKEVRSSELQVLLERPRPNPESGRTRLMAARGYQLIGQLDKAAAELAAGRKAEPDNLRLALAEATLRLQRANTEPESLIAEEKLKLAMAKIEREARDPDNPPAFRDECRTIWIHGLVTRTIRMVMSGSIDDARLVLKRATPAGRGENAHYFAAVEEILASVP